MHANTHTPQLTGINTRTEYLVGLKKKKKTSTELSIRNCTNLSVHLWPITQAKKMRMVALEVVLVVIGHRYSGAGGEINPSHTYYVRAI